MNTDKFFLHTKHLSENGIALYVDAIKLECVYRLPAAITRHVEECEECKMQIMDVVELVADEQYDRTTQHPFFDRKEYSTSPFSTIYRIAAVLVIAAFIGTVYYVLTNTTQNTILDRQPVIAEEQTPHSLPDTAPAIKQKQSVTQSKVATDALLAANFEPSPNLDDLVQTQFRSTTVEIISPAIGEVVNAPVTFRWKQYEKQVKIKILSNKELTLVASTLSGNSFTTSKKFAPGLYYWKLETSDELLYVGKFLVK